MVQSTRKQDPKGLYVVDFEIVPESGALLVIDLQKYMCRKDIGLGPLYIKEAPQIAEYWFSRMYEVVIPNTQKLLAFFRANQLRVTYACVGPLLPDASDMIPRRRIRDLNRIKMAGSDHFFHVGTVEHEVIDELKPHPNEMVFKKNTSSAFTSTNIDQILRNMGIDSLIITGMVTSTCVEHTARDAADRGYNCILVEDACTDKHQDAHEMAMMNFARSYGRVMSTQETINYLKLRLKAVE